MAKNTKTIEKLERLEKGLMEFGYAVLGLLIALGMLWVAWMIW